jgi:hypothetical protein
MQMNRRLKCELTQKEKAAFLADAGKLEARRTQKEHTEEAHKAEAKSAKDDAASLDRDARYMLKCINDGYETRDVICDETYQEAVKKMVTTRTDTGEIIDSRGLTAEERQLHIPNLDAPPTIQ